MSIKIGDGLVDLQNAVTNRERLILSSASYSNLVQITSGTGNVQFTLNDYTFGKQDNSFLFQGSSGNTMARFSTSGNTITGITRITSNVSVTGGNIVVSGPAYTQSLFTSNIWAFACNVPNTTSVLRVQYSNVNTAAPVDLLNVRPTNILMQGPVGIGTTIPRDYVDINSNLYVSRVITTPDLNVSRINNGAFNSILFSPTKLQLNGNIEANGSFTVKGDFNYDGNFAVDSVTADDVIMAQRARFAMSSNTSPIIDVVYTGVQEYPLSSNATVSSKAPKIVDVKFNLLESNQRNVFNIDATGKVGVGTNAPNALMHMQYGVSNYTNNLLFAQGLSNYSQFVIDLKGNLGIGTSVSKHNVHIQRQRNDYTYGSNAYIGLYQDDPFPIITYTPALSNLYWTSNLSVQPSSSNYVSDSNIWWDFIQTATSWGSNLLYGSNLIYYEIALSNYQPLSPFLTCTSNAIEVFAIESHGGLRIRCSNMDSNLGLCVKGRGQIDELQTYRIVCEPSVSNIDFVASSLSNINNFSACNATFRKVYVDHLESYHHTYTSNYEIQGLQCFSASSEFSVMLDKVIFTGSATILSNVAISQDTPPSVCNVVDYDPVVDGKLKILAATPSSDTAISRAINIVGDKNTSVRVYSATRRPQIELATPLATGKMLVDFTDGSMILAHEGTDARIRILTSGDMYFGSRISFSQSGNVGINNNSQTLAPVPLYVRGTTNIVNATALDSVLYVDASATNKTVGIATNAPFTSYNLHVNGTSLFTSTTQFNSTVQALNRIGIGTTSPTSQLHVYASDPSSAVDMLRMQSLSNVAMTVRSNGNVGIGTTLPMFALHVTGDLNFDGGLFQGGSRYISSQWTSVGSSNISIFGNIGIGTAVPMYALHCQSNAFFGSNITVNNNVYARGSFISTSDRQLKTNLERIQDPLNKIEHLTGYVYDRIDTGKKDTGLIAQEVLDVLPEAVSLDERNMLTIAYGNLAGLFVEALKDMREEIRQLKEEVAELKLRVPS